MEYYTPKLPCDAAQISRFRKVLGEAGVEQLLKATIETAVALQTVKKTEFERVIVDTTVQEKAIAHPTDARLLDVARQLVLRHAQRAGIALKMTYEREGKTLRRRAGGYAHAKQFKRLKTVGTGQKTWLRRRQAVEPAIGHLKAEHRTGRCWLRGTDGDALHAVLCAAGFNIRWLLRAIAEQAAKAAKAFFFVLLWLALWLPLALVGRYAGIRTAKASKKRRTCGVGAYAEERLQHPLWVAG